jgi:carboxymethylenebutenolidase
VTDFEQLTAGDTIARALVRVPPGARAGVVVLHAWWGLNEDVIAFADRLAEAGFAVLAPDLFDGQVASTVEDAERLAGGSDDEQIQPIVLAAVDTLGERLGPGAPLAALGFSFGAAWAIWAPIQRDRVGATAVYYGTWTGSVLGRAKVPLLGHFAEDDPYETPETVAELEEGLREAGREAEIHHYPGTGHWFAEPSNDAYRADAAELAFERTMTFLRHHLAAS